MSHAPSPAIARAEPRMDRWQHWIAVLASTLLHVLFLVLAWLSSPVNVTPPQGSAAGSRMAVDLIGVTPTPPTPLPMASPAAASTPVARAAAASRTQTTLVSKADDPVPPQAARTAEGMAAARGVQARQRPPLPAPVAAEIEANAPPLPRAAQVAAATPPPTPPRRTHVWGQPPGMLQENLAPENAGRSRSPTTQRGRGNDTSAAQASLEVGGYQVFYDLLSETRLRAWRDRGMTEIFLPLPGTRRLMVCPLETALRRDSGPCRMLEPDDPELQSIGDAREVINMQRVYRQGEPVWRGPGPYK